MDEPYQEKHAEFVLNCAPLRDANGRYVPHLVATRITRDGHEDVDVELPPTESFINPSAAAEFAHTFGKRWVRDRILPTGFDSRY